jgi:excisionase family DNA binding protein
MPTVFHTVEGHALSDADRDRVAEFTQSVHATQDLPEAIRDALAAVLNLVAEGHDVAMLEAATHLSPNDAARLVGVSRPLLNQILDEGRITFFETAGGHRKIKLAAVLAYIQERDDIAAQLAAARAARKPDGDVIAEELGLDPETAKRLGIA